LNISVSDQLKLAMRSLAQPVVVITTAADGTRHAMSATSVTSVSLDPPSMLFCMNRSASSHPTLLAGAGFCINMLGLHHELLARLCSGAAKGEARFAEGQWDYDGDGIPYLVDAQASISCVQDGRMSYGTHDIFIGKVKSVRTTDFVRPLVYVDGTYSGIAR
jgi:flavin reductase (DIM6/NTAB) family NADH-FMN oxidoreductase RutF